MQASQAEWKFHVTRDNTYNSSYNNFLGQYAYVHSYYA